MVSLILDKIQGRHGNICTWKISKTIGNGTINNTLINVIWSHKTDFFFVKLHKKFQGFQKAKVE